MRGRWPPPPASHAHVVPRLAATVALVRPAGTRAFEVLLTQRPATMAFAGDVYVFPGGAVDATDADPGLVGRADRDPAEARDVLGGDLDAATSLAVHVAAIRELAEEAGVLLVDPPPVPDIVAQAHRRILGKEPLTATLAWLDATTGRPTRLRARSLRPVSRWVTPPLLPRRFDARVFVAPLPSGAQPSFASGEVVAHRWIEPAAALDAGARGELEFWLPTFATLQQLAAARDLDGLEHLPRFGAWQPPELREVAPGLAEVRLAGLGGVPGRRGSAWLVGREQVVLVDPGDPSPEAADGMLAAIAARGGRLAAIVVTSTDPDRAAGAEAIAMQAGVEILAGRRATGRLPHALVELDDGAPLPHGDVPLRAHLHGEARGAAALTLEVVGTGVRLPVSEAGTPAGFGG